MGGFYQTDDCDLAAFAAQLDRRTEPADAPGAAEIVQNVPVYAGGELREKLSGVARLGIMAEWATILGDGPGVLAIKGAFEDTGVIDATTDAFNRIIASEKAGDGGGGDHFAAAGANDRIWNAHQKLCLADPGAYAAYASNPLIALAAEAWLGPNYQVTAQVNLVHPGGAAQSAHRDYHLGFQTADGAAAYPAHLHHMTAALTLQGAVAHCDMPVESGPTKLLPFSQGYGPGYLAFHRPEFREFFEQNHVQIPLGKGDLLFFNPALFHAAGENRTTNIARMANLLQISCAFGRAMEALDRDAMCRAVYPAMKGISGRDEAALIAATAEGYAFPTNLDRDPPIGGLAPKSQADILRQARAENWPEADFAAALDALNERRTP